MAPIPTEKAPPTKVLEKRGGIGTGSIVGISILVFFAVGFAITITLYFLHKRAERRKLPPENRPVSYHPFRTNSSAKSSLLANQAPTPEDDKTSMFSRDRGSSLSLYVDTDMHDRRKSVDTVPLIPLQITPAEDVHNPMDRAASVGSGVSGRLSLSPSRNISEEQDQGSRRTRPRSTSAASTRYYEANSPLNGVPASGSAPQIPKIVHTLSD
jgi:hypothetical protein